ncbi:hypothetical protein C8J23_1585 [Shewanella chilikensis]|uniref:Uncharacterized protein n=1 Tax=Shewanella chilikensis TaxID=558541 RepID=A0ABX5PHK1_9GAMM|nr:hypothetical protein C8J23_1585 [Shewanella chilikensis]
MEQVGSGLSSTVNINVKFRLMLTTRFCCWYIVFHVEVSIAPPVYLKSRQCHGLKFGERSNKIIEHMEEFLENR